MGARTSLPIYVTRKTGYGEIAQYDLPFWMTALFVIVIWLNVVLWGLLGLYVVVEILL